MTSTYRPPTASTAGPDLDLNSIGTRAIASATRRLVAFEMRIPEEVVSRAMALSNWMTIAEMIEREFIDAYRGYYPKCGMALLDEAVIAEVFDSLTITFDDSCRALRSGIWTTPAAPAGGHSDG